MIAITLASVVGCWVCLFRRREQLWQKKVVDKHRLRATCLTMMVFQRCRGMLLLCGHVILELGHVANPPERLKSYGEKWLATFFVDTGGFAIDVPMHPNMAVIFRDVKGEAVDVQKYCFILKACHHCTLWTARRLRFNRFHGGLAPPQSYEQISTTTPRQIRVDLFFVAPYGVNNDGCFFFSKHTYKRN